MKILHVLFALLVIKNAKLISIIILMNNLYITQNFLKKN